MALQNRLAGIDLRLEQLTGRVNLIAWMVGTNIVVTLGVLWKLLAHR
jgi:hypothetical protein